MDFPQDMKIESERLKTYWGKWPVPYIDILDLVKAGFYYTQVQDKVKCAFCEGVLTSWELGDCPTLEHVRHFPLCPFVMGRDVGNIPLSSRDTQRPSKEDNFLSVIFENHPEYIKRIQDDQLQVLGIVRHDGPRHPGQVSFDARLRSFQSWPLVNTVNQDFLAEAGFFYTGLRHNTKCFNCDCDISNWNLGRNPWIEHAKCSPSCTFVRLNKGEPFIKACVEGKIDPNDVKPNGSVNSEHTNHPKPVSFELSSIHQKVDDIMNSNVLQGFLRKAIVGHIEKKGEGPKDVSSILEAIDTEKNKVQSKTDQCPTTVESQTLENNETNHENDELDFSIEESEDLMNLLTFSLEDPAVDLEEENRLLKGQRTCKICMDQEAEVVFLPCGHLITCTICAPALIDCPLCRASIKGTVKTFLN